MMTPFLGVHGIWNLSYFDKANQDLLRATAAASADWLEWTVRSFGRHVPGAPVPSQLPVAYYADLLDQGVGMSTDPLLLDPFAQVLFIEWAHEILAAEAAETAEDVFDPIAKGRLTAMLRQAAAVFTERFGDGCVPMVSAAVSELSVYFDPDSASVRRAVRARLADALGRYRPRVLIAHSLGSVVAYETLHAYPEIRIERLLTLGSPLAMRKVVYERLEPQPLWGKGARPPGVRDWANVSDRGDFVAVPRGALPMRFDGVTHDLETSIHLLDPHRARFYLDNSEVAELLAPFL
jgi:pimeloyl-ACP methyl ester carboxylesterase